LLVFRILVSGRRGHNKKKIPLAAASETEGVAPRAPLHRPPLTYADLAHRVLHPSSRPSWVKTMATVSWCFFREWRSVDRTLCFIRSKLMFPSMPKQRILCACGVRRQLAGWLGRHSMPPGGRARKGCGWHRPHTYFHPPRECRFVAQHARNRLLLSLLRTRGGRRCVRTFDRLLIRSPDSLLTAHPYTSL
jgi:hypothetical protein